MSPRHKDEIAEKKSSPLKMTVKIPETQRDEKEKIIRKSSPDIRDQIEERRKILDEYITISQDAKAAEKSVNVKKEENKGALTLSNGRTLSTSEKRVEEKENIPRPRSRNIEKVHKYINIYSQISDEMSKICKRVLYM